MTGFNLDFSKATQTGGVKDGTYEVVVNRASEEATQGGAEYIELDLIIRNDIQQLCQNMHLFPKVWKSKKDNQYNMGMIMTIAQALGLEDGKSYSGLDELFTDMVLRPVNVVVKNEESNGYKNLNVKRWSPSRFKEMNHQFKNGDEPSFGRDKNVAPTVGDDDLPF